MSHSLVNQQLMKVKIKLAPLNLFFKLFIYSQAALNVCMFYFTAGGPLREFLHLVVAEIHRNNTLLCGAPSSRTLTHNIHELEKNTYYHIGALLATSIVHGGPAPSFFCNAVTEFIVFGISIVKATIDDVPDPSVKESLQKVILLYNWYPTGFDD